MPGTQGGSAPPRKRQPARRKPAPSVGSAIQRAAPKGPAFGAPSAATRRRQRQAVAGKTFGGNTLRPVVKKPKGGGGILGDVERAVGGAAHLLYPKTKKGGSSARGTGRLPGAAAGGRSRSLDLPNSAVGIVLRSTASTTAQQPGRTAGDTAKLALLIPAGLARLILHPKSSTEAIGADYKRRYAPALRGNYRQFHRRQLVEGAAPEAFDIAGVVSAGGTVTGRVLQSAARTGRLGQKAERLSGVTRPLRVAGGEAGVVVRAPSKNFYKNVTRHAVDRRRGSKQAGRAPGTRTALEDVAQREGQVTYAGRRKQARVQRRMVAKRGGEVLATMKAEQALEVLGKTGVSGTLQALSRDERRGLNLASRYGVRTPEQARRVIDALEQRIVRERAAREAAGDPVRPLNDELPILAALRADADKVFTPRLRAAVKYEGNRNRRLSAQDPDLVQQQTLARTHQPQADLLGVKRLKNETPAEFRKRRAALVRQERSARRKLAKARGTERVAEARTTHRVASSDRRLVASIVREAESPKHPDHAAVVTYAENVRAYNKAAKALRDARAAYGNAARYRNAPSYDVTEASKAVKRLEVAEAKAKAAREAVGVSEAEMIRLADIHAGRKAAAGEHDGRLAALGRVRATGLERAAGRTKQAEVRAAKLKELLDSIEPRKDGESAVAFARRVRQEGSKQGLGSPAYFKSEEVPRNVFSAFAKSGRRAVAGEKKYEGVLAATGRESHSPEILIRQAAQNIKRRFNWNLVGDTVDEHVLPWSKEKKFTAHELEKEVIRRGIDPQSVRLWNPRLYREMRANVGEHAADADPTAVSKSAETALTRATGDLHDLALDPEHFKASGWQVLDKAAFDEVMGTVGSGQEGVVGRSYDIAKGKVSRVLLANPAWLGFQVASNVFTSGLAGVTPADFIRAQKFFGKEAMKDPKHAAAVEATFGVHGWYDQQRMLGSTSNSRFVDAYRGMKETAFYRKAHSANPLDLLFFRPDNAQNNAFRRALMYNRLKRETYRQMGRDASTIVKAQQRISGMLTGPPEEVMSRLTRNRALLEKHAHAVDDFLGNWTTYTAKERHYFSRFVMFYGFLRFSTRLAFYTMPAKHPIMSSILLQIGRMEKDELTKIFGTEPPPWEYGNFYAPGKAWGQGVSDAEIAQGVTRFPTNRLVPFFNAVTAASGGGELGSLPPFVGTYLNYRAGKNVALDSPYQVEGSTAYVQHAKDMKGPTRRRIALAETLSLSPYYRAAAAAFMQGKQGDDSLLFDQRPIQYKKADALARNQAKIAAQQKAGIVGALRTTLAPEFGTPGSQIILNARSFAAGPKPKKSGRGRSGGGGATFKLGGGSSGSGGSSGATFKLGGG